MKYTKEGIERSGEIWREGLARVSEFTAPQSETRLAPYDARDDLLQ